MGPIALAEQSLLVDAVGLMLIVVVPVFVMAFLFAWRYRSSNANARYAPDWSQSVAVDAVIWLLPAAIIVLLGLMVWRSTHRLDPYRPIDSAVEPIKVEAMPGMQTQLHLEANAPGRFEGRNMQYSGRGFADQHFEAIAISEQDFDAWLAKVRQSPNNLDSVAYRALAARGIAQATYYSAVETSLFDTIVAKHAPEPAHMSGHARRDSTCWGD
jgi:cytochrome o ubiquinol oxidase subunit 2